MQIIGRPACWFILLMIPFVNIVTTFIVCIDLAKSFGKGAGFGIALVFFAPICFLILGFGSAQYKGPSAVEAPAAA